MTTGTVPTPRDGQAGERTTTQARPSPRPRPRPRPRSDATTRYLCAAAQLDPGFAERAVGEFLVEPVRAIPPTPGVDAAAVLREAVAARERCRFRDAILLLALVTAAFGSFPLLLVWLAVAIPVAVVLRYSGSGRRRGRWAAAVVVGAAAVVVVLVVLLAMRGRGLGAFLRVPSSVTLAGFVLAVALILVVLAIDEFTVHFLVHTCFRPGRFVPDAGGSPSGWERGARTVGHQRYRNALHRVAVSGTLMDDPRWADVVVHRGFDPFIGAGVPVLRQLIALPLEPDKDEETGEVAQPSEINVVELHLHVGQALDRLRMSSSLGPGQRFEHITRREQVLMSADRLVKNLHQYPAEWVLPDVGQPPLAQMDLQAARWLADNPQEWARYYQVFRVEAWDRDLTTSCFLHAGTDRRMLFLEWTFCALLPIDDDYRGIDEYRAPIRTPLAATVVELLAFPATAIRRLRTVFHWFVPLKQHRQELVPDRYGAGASLREMAAGDDVQTYFQYADVVRYVKVLDAALIRAVGDYLQDRGYSVVEFQRQAQAATYDLRGASIQGSAFGKAGSVQGNVFSGSAAGGKEQR